MKTPIRGSTYVTRSDNAADARMVNLFPEVIPEGGKEPAYLQRCPGLQNLGKQVDHPGVGGVDRPGHIRRATDRGLHQELPA